MRHFLCFLCSIVVYFLCSSAYALDTSIDSGKSQKSDKEQSQSLKKSQERKESSGKKSTKTTSTGLDRQDQEAIKTIGQVMSQAGTDVTLPLETVFLDKIAELEASTEPYKTCKIATAPRLSRDFGLSAEIRPGVIDTIKADFLSKAGQSNSAVRDLADEGAIKTYRDCLAQYGATIAQAYLYLTQDLAGIKGSVRKSKDGSIEIKGMGYDDFIELANSALQKAVEGVKNQTILRMRDRTEKDKSPCQFDREVANIKCGSSLIVLGTKPQLFVSGIQWYGDRFAGYQGSYKLSRSWSYQDAIEQLKQTSKYSKWASDVQAYTETLESKGMAKEAAMVRKKAWELAKSGRNTVSPSHLLGHVH